MSETTDLRYPIGKMKEQPFANLEEYEEAAKDAMLHDIKFLPSLLEMAVENLDEQQLHTPYRPGGWTVQQLVHHVADSHMNAYIRFKLALTEDNPTIKPYNEAAWAELSDTRVLPINISMTLLHALHTRWYEVLAHMQEQNWNKTVFHPEQKGSITCWKLLQTYAWHGRHHVAHITALRERMGW